VVAGGKVLLPVYGIITAFKKKIYKASSKKFWLLALTFLVFCFPQPAVSSSQTNWGYDLKEGQEVPPHLLKNAMSLSAGQSLLLEDTCNLFFSNVPEFPTEPGILCRADDVLSPSGTVRVLFSHMNLLIDWSGSEPKNKPGTVGFALENQTGRTLDIYAVRGAIACNLATDGTRLFLEDAAPVKPGESEPQYYGSAVGNYVVREFYSSEERGPVNLGTVQPGGRFIMSQDVGPRGWAVGMYDLVLVDTATGRPLLRSDFNEKERIGLETFIAPLPVNLDSFLAEQLRSGQVLSPGQNQRHHMRGLFVPGNYPDNPDGEAVSKRATISYSSLEGQPASFALSAAYAGEKEPDVFTNDLLINGYDPSTPGIKGVNRGNYGSEYTIKLDLTGPVALVFQGALQSDFVDVYNQINTVWLDGRVKAVTIRDPNFDKYYTDFAALREPGYGQVIGVYPSTGKHEHLLRFMLAPNCYGPVRFYLLPLGQTEAGA
jgi:hypothetical protein